VAGSIAGKRYRSGSIAFGRVLEADEPLHEGVVAGVGGIAVGLGELQIEAMLGGGERGLRHRQVDAAQARRADRDEERLDRFGAAGESSRPCWTRSPPERAVRSTRSV
jgi:hypothetical protein